MPKVYVLSKFERNPYPKAKLVDTTSNSGMWSGLSPFILDATKYGARRFENLWQFSKVYPEYQGMDGMPTSEWWNWQRKGFLNERAIRYPMGKGRIPLYSYWNRIKLDYVDARKTIYAPIYAELVQTTPSFDRLKWFYEQGFDLALRDYDGYDYSLLGITLTQVINNPKRKMGHAFVLAMILEGYLDGSLAKEIRLPCQPPESREATGHEWAMMVEPDTDYWLAKRVRVSVES